MKTAVSSIFAYKCKYKLLDTVNAAINKCSYSLGSNIQVLEITGYLCTLGPRNTHVMYYFKSCPNICADCHPSPPSCFPQERNGQESSSGATAACRNSPLMAGQGPAWAGDALCDMSQLPRNFAVVQWEVIERQRCFKRYEDSCNRQLNHTFKSSLKL